MIKIQNRILMASAIVTAALLVMGSFGTFALQEADAAKGGKVKTGNIAVSQVNDCGNGDNPIDVFCQNAVVIGTDNNVTLTQS